MSTYTLNSPATGVSHTVDFSGEPTLQDMEYAVTQLDAPILALKRQNQNTKLTELLGGEPVNAEGQTYSETQRPADQLLIRRELLNQQQAQVGKEAKKAADLERTGPLGSFQAGAVTSVAAPFGLGATGLQALIQKALGEKANAPELQMLMGSQPQQSLSDIITQAAQNPGFGTAGAIAPIIVSGGIGGVSKNLAQAIEAGSLKAATPFLTQAAKQAGTAGGINVGINTGVRTLSGAETTPLDVAADMAFGLVGGRRVSERPSVATGNLKGPIAERGVFKQPLNAATTEALGITPIEGAMDLIPVVKSSVLEANGGILPQGKAPKVVLQEAMDFKINQYKDGLQVGQDLGLAHSVKSLEDAMTSRLNELHSSFGPEKVARIVDSVKAEHPAFFNQEYASPVQGQELAAQINRDVNVKNPNRVPKSSEVLNAETALSQELSRQGREIYQAATGTNGTPNQDWGILTQAQDGLIGELKSAQKTDAGKTPGGTGVATTTKGILGKLSKRAGGRVLVPTQNENVVNSFQRVLNEGEARPDLGILNPEAQQGLIQQYTPRSPSPVATPSLTDLLQEAMKQIPAEYQGLPQAAKEQLAREILQGNVRPRLRALTGETINR